MQRAYLEQLRADKRDSAGNGKVPVATSFKHGFNASFSMKFVEYFDQLSDYLFLKRPTFNGVC
jgi:hypothetical protein